MKRMLITGFAPFGGFALNPAWQAIQALPDAVGSWALVKRELPVAFRGGPEALLASLEETEPDALLMVGVAGGRDAVTPERQGTNEMTARIPDNEGRQPQHEPIVPGGPEVLCSTLPVEDMTDAIQAAGIPARLSDSAGRFVCNTLLYSALYHLESWEDPIPAAFIHVPATPESAAGPDVPTLTLDEITAALQAAILAI